jgi:outer membrane protein insertion porin family
MAPAGRAARRSGAIGLAPAIAALTPIAAPALTPVLILALLLLAAATPAHAREEFPRGTITEVRVQGNVTISSEQVRAKLLSRAGAPLEQHKIDADIKSLVATKWFSEVTPYYSPDPNGQGFILTFAVTERPVLGSVEFRGRTKISLKDIEEATGLKKGNRADAAKTHLAVSQIQRLYAEKGYDDAEVQLIAGGNTGDTKVVISIFEGEKHKVGGIEFEGNVFATDATLRLKITSRTAILGLIGGRYHRDNLEEDRRKLVEYYQGQGFFDVKVTPVTDYGSSLGDVRLTYVIDEGVRYKVRNVSFEGNTKVPSEVLKQGLMMHSGQPILDTLKESDRKLLLSKYYDLGCIDTQVNGDARLTDQPGVIDLLYRIDEGDPYLLGELIIRGNERTKDKVLRREAANAGLLPGEILNLNRFDAYKNRLSSLGYFVNAPDQGKQIEVKIVDRRPADKPYGDNVTLDPNDVSLTRMQGPEPQALPDAADANGTPAPIDPPARARFQNPDPEPAPDPSVNAPTPAGPRMARPAATIIEGLEPFGSGNPFSKPAPARTRARARVRVATAEPPTRARLQNPDAEALPPVDAPALPPGGAGAGPRLAAPPGAVGPDGLQPFGTGNAFSPPPDTLPPINAPAAPGAVPAVPGVVGVPTTPPVGAGEPPGDFPSIPGMNATDVGPDRQDPFPNRAFANIITSVEEAPTGRFSLGVGASGFQGLNGTVAVNEKNFDLLNFPRSLDDITSGKAFRGGGQDFQMQLMVGTLINRFLISLRDPYIFDLPVGAGATGYLFQRIYPDWTESRAGGRFSLGRQFGTATYADVAFRVENIQFYGYQTPAPAEFLAASGHSILASIRPSVRFDNRNSPFLPSKGQYLEFSFEQGWGTFTYPKAEIEGRTYFTLGSRPDGSGPRILTMRGHFGVTGPDTPVYERFFAGYLGSLRGFAYRGVGPHVDGVNVGGLLMAVGSLEYMFPLTASDKIRQVIFTDFGSVNNQYNINDFRVSVGTGIRLNLPMMGPLPMAFDLAFPVLKAPGDRVNYFNFSIGAMY